MKRILALLSAAVMCLSLCACGEEEKEITSIEITMDNWQDYFEIIEEDFVGKNDFDEITTIYRTYYLVLKDEYEMAESDTSIAVEFNYIIEWRYVQIDKQAGVLTIGELVPDWENEEKNGVMTTITKAKQNLLSSHRFNDENSSQGVPTNLEIVRIQGTLYIVE